MKCKLGKYIDLSGQKFGKLTVIERVEDHITPSGQHKQLWLCRCDCGNEKIIRGEFLRNGSTMSCGCLKIIDLTGQRFGNLTVIERAEDHFSKNGNKKICWKCICDCGKEHITTSEILRGGDCKSCGCISSKIRSEKIRKYNIYDLSGDYGIGYTEEGNEFYFDLEDYNKIKDYYWNYISEQNHHLIAYKIGEQTHLYLHRLIMNLDDKSLVVDHINPLHPEDNRKQNLRICTQANNTINSGIQRNNKSGVTGVVWVEQINRWTAQITYQKKRIHLGSFENLEDAIKARENAEIKYFGEYRYQKSENLDTPHQV